MDDIYKAILLGIVEGLTEFLPVSSTGHLVLFGHALAFTGPKAETFEIFIQSGAILAVVLLYWRRFLRLNPSVKDGDGFSGVPGLLKIGVACGPAFVLGFLLHSFIKSRLLYPFPVAIALIVGGIALMIIERQKERVRIHELGSLTLWHCFMVGLFQCLALWPGISRAGATIVGAMLIGVERKVAAEFSFIVAVPVLVAATAYDMLKSYQLLGRSDVPIFAVGFIVSFACALVAIKSFIRFVSTMTLVPFGYYRVVLGFLVLILL